MSEFLCIRWNDANAAKPQPVVGYSVHTDKTAAQAYIEEHRKIHPTHRPELISDKKEIGARKIILAGNNRLRKAFEELHEDSINDIWVPVSQKPGQQSLELRALQVALHADGASENVLPIVLIPTKS